MFVSKSKSSCVSPDQKQQQYFVTRVGEEVLMFVSKSKRSSVLPEQKQQYYFVTSVEVEEVVVCHQSFAITRCQHLLTHLLVHSFTQSFTHLLSHLSQHSVNHSLSHTLTHSRAQYPITSNLLDHSKRFNDKQGPSHSGLTKVGLLRQKCITEM